MNLTNYRKRSGYGKRVAWSRNAVAAKARKRMERAVEGLPPRIEIPPPKAIALPFATVAITIGKERITFRVSRWDEKRLFCLGKIQASSTIGKRVALTLNAML